MKKITTKSVLLGIVTLGILAMSVATLGWGSNNRWDSKFIKSNSGGETDKTTTNLTTGQEYDKNGNPVGTPAPVPADEKNYGDGKLNCREAVVKVVTVFDSPTSSGTSSIKVPELAHLATRSFNCTAVNPPLTNSYGIKTTSGTITIKCGNGQLFVAASTCTAPTPTPTPVPTATPTATATATPIPTPTPTPAPPAGYSVRACSSWCSDTTYSCRKSSGKGGYTTTYYKRCQSGQAYFTGSGTCGAVPTNCL